MPGNATSWERFAARSRAFLHRHWQQLLLIRERLRLSEEAFHLILAAGVGVIGGLINLVYFGCNLLVKWIAWGGPGDFIELSLNRSPWLIVLVPTLGGLAAGLVLFLGLRLLGNPGLSNLLEVVVAGDGRLPARPALVNALSSLISISTGASIGREGLIIQLSSTMASKFGQWAHWPPYRLRLLVACGAAAGIAAGCNAPIAGAVFAAQIVLGNFSMSLFAPLVISSVVATMVSRPFFGTGQWFEVPAFEFTRLQQLPFFLVLGVLAGILGATFLKLLRHGHELSNRLPVPLYIRVALAGLVVGLIALAFPEVLGNGYSATNLMLSNPVLPLSFVSGILVAKLLATVATVGSGTVGGVFTPTLFLGAALGSLFGALLHQLGVSLPVDTRVYAVAGMGSLLAATTHSPLLAMIMMFELSLNYSVMPPLMVSCVVATLVARSLHKDSIYTEPLRRKGLELDRESSRIGAASEKTVADIMLKPVPPLRETATIREMADRFLTGANNFLPVVDADQRLVGIVALHDLKSYLGAGEELNSVIACDVMRPPPACLTPTQRVSDILPVLLASELRNVPVVSSLPEYKLVGAVARGEALSLLSEAISARTTSEK